MGSSRVHAEAKKSTTLPTPAVTLERSRLLQRKCSCENSADLVQRAVHPGKSSEIPEVVTEVLRSPGQSLDQQARTFMESRFGHDFSQVKVHTDAKAAESARAVDALAYTSGNNVVFGSQQYAPNTSTGRKLIAHELAHVVQQGGNAASVQAQSLSHDYDSTEQEAEIAAQSVMDGNRPHIALSASKTMLHRHKDDLVAYSGGQSGSLMVVQAGKLIYTAPAVSGHPGHAEHEPNEGPIPAGTYTLHPQITRPTVSTLQGGVCGANGINSGYQEITSDKCSPCTGAHYCNVPCPSPENSAQKGFTPKDCWGPKRIKIEGSATVTTPTGGKVKRDAFYIHGGNPADAVSSGCIKSLNDDVFAEIQKLNGVKGAVPLCVGGACPPSLKTAIDKAATEAVSNVFESVAEAVTSIF